ncbi:MAG TPA: DNA mismatch repair protein MutS [Bacilli bacterium]|nr:DNA mismatch repair protein MutS [Bacilli bacterium]
MYEAIDKNQYTPMMRQYLEIKEQYQDAIVFFRLGDFYEMFFNDAIVASKELEIVLTGRDAGTTERVPMCGVPYHSVSSYIDKLTAKGYKVAIVEQVEDPKDAKGIVKREVIRVITPGTITDGGNISETDNNFLVSVDEAKNRYILAYTDLSTGENYLTTIPLIGDILRAEILNLRTKEIVISSTFNQAVLDPLKQVTSITISIEDNIQDVNYLKSLSQDLDKEEQIVFNRLINYVIKTQKRTLVHLQPVSKYSIDGFLKIDFSSQRNLELIETLRFQNRKNTLLSVLDKCETAMGSRLLKKNISFPLVDRNEIIGRYDVIDKLHKFFLETSEIRNYLKDVYDLERIVGRISYGNANPRDLLQLKKSLNTIPSIKRRLERMKLHEYFQLDTYYQDYLTIYQLIDKSILEDAPLTIKEGNIIKPGFNKELDELQMMSKNNKEYLLNLEAREQERTGIRNLKVGFNRVFGYYIEVTKSNIPLIKEEFGYIRKQTLTNAERYITEELKEKETQILRAEEKSIELEYNLFIEIRNTIKNYTKQLQFLAKQLAKLDMLQAFARVSKENNYVRPVITDKSMINIKAGRHPVIEHFLDEPFIANDLYMDENESVILITGPNMSGKSTFMRQIALIAIMAQIGCFVPAKSAEIPIFDAIFTRIGAADDIVSGQSTFMVEMMEVNNALKYATNRSLILFDEIGRGTATFDGMALAQAIIEYVHEKIKCKTLFSTHYHELTALEESLPNLKNVHVSAIEEKGNVVFVHKVLPGAIDKSYGINVAKLAKLPDEVILRANDLLIKLEQNSNYDKKMSIEHYVQPLIFDSKTPQEQEVIDEIKQLNLNQTSPLEALNILDSLQKKLK